MFVSMKYLVSFNVQVIVEVLEAESRLTKVSIVFEKVFSAKKGEKYCVGCTHFRAVHLECLDQIKIYIHKFPALCCRTKVV